MTEIYAPFDIYTLHIFHEYLSLGVKNEKE